MLYNHIIHDPVTGNRTEDLSEKKFIEMNKNLRFALRKSEINAFIKFHEHLHRGWFTYSYASYLSRSRFEKLDKKEKSKLMLDVLIVDEVQDINPPVMALLLELMRPNYENHSNIFFENSAISNENKLQYIYTVNQNQLANYDKHISGISSFKKKHLLKHGVKSKDIIKEKVNSLTLKEVLDKYNFTNLDLLVIDAEGYDGYIVNNYFKDCSFQPIIIFEYIHIETHIFEKLIKVLKSKKYNFFKVEENLICFPNNKKIIL